MEEGRGVVVSVSLGGDVHRMKGYGHVEGEEQDALSRKEEGMMDEEMMDEEEMMEEEEEMMEEEAGAPRMSMIPDQDHQVEPLFVNDEREIGEYISTYVDGVLSNEAKKHENWKERVDAMVLLERLVLGGAGTYPLFIQEMNACHHIFENQLLDRRSSVSKQACVLVGTLMEHCGYSVRSLALALQPSLIKLHGISIAVVAHGAQECLDFVYEYCHDGRLLSHLCSTVCTDRNPKLRQGAASQLLRAVECWEHAIVEQYKVDIEQTIICAISDATSETRTVGRLAFESYCARYTEHAQRLLDGLSSTVKDPKVRTLMVELFQKRQVSPNNTASEAAMKPAFRRGVSGADIDMVTPKPKKSGMRHSMTTGPKRVVVNAKRLEDTSYVQKTNTDAPKSAFFDRSKTSRASLPGGAVRISTGNAPGRKSTSGSIPVQKHQYQQEEPDMDLSGIVHRLYSPGLVWNEKVQCMKSLENILESDDIGPCTNEVFDMMTDALVSEISDAHYKVSCQAMATLSVAFRNLSCRHHLQQHLEDVVPSLLVKIGDTKEVIRNSASEALETVKENCDADLVMQGIVGATRTCKSTKSQCAIMLYFEDIFSTHKGASGNAWRTMLAYCLRMATNKNPDVREHAIAACARVYHSGKSAAVDAALSGLPKSPRNCIKAALDKHAPPTEAASSISEAFGLFNDHVQDDEEEEQSASFLIKSSEDDCNSDISFGEVCAPGNIEYEEALADLDLSDGKERRDINHPVNNCIWELVSNLQSSPSEDTFRCLNSVDSSAVMSLSRDERETIGNAIWEAFMGLLLMDKKAEDSVLSAACSSIISYFSFLSKENIEKNIDHVMEALLGLGDMNDYELSTIAIAAGIQLVKAADPADAYSCLGQMLPSSTELPPFQGLEARRACNVLKFLRPCLRQIPEAQIRVALDVTMPSLCNCFTSPHPEIRHLSLDCIVMIQKLVGPLKTAKYTALLTKTQQQLIRIQAEK